MVVESLAPVVGPSLVVAVLLSSPQAAAELLCSMLVVGPSLVVAAVPYLVVDLGWDQNPAAVPYLVVAAVPSVEI